MEAIGFLSGPRLNQVQEDQGVGGILEHRQDADRLGTLLVANTEAVCKQLEEPAGAPNRANNTSSPQLGLRVPHLVALCTAHIVASFHKR